MLINNGTTPTLMFLMVDSTDDETAKTGLTVTAQISKNGGTFTNTTNAVTEVSNGWYKVVLTATETNTNGPLAIRANGTAADEWRDLHEVVPVPNNISTSDVLTQVASALATYDAPTKAELDAAVLAINEFSDLPSGYAKAGSTATKLMLADADNIATADYVGFGALFIYLDGSRAYRMVTAFNTVEGSITLERALNVTPDTTTRYVLGPAANEVFKRIEASVENVSTFDPTTSDVTIASAQITDIATTLLGTTMPTTVPAAGANPTVGQMLLMTGVTLGIFKMTVVGTVITVYNYQGTVPLMTWDINSATTPTTRTRTGL